MTLTHELDRLDALYDKGRLTSEEYSRAKAAVLDDYGAPTERRRPILTDKVNGLRPTEWALALHLSQYAGYAVPFAGWAAPVGIWLWKRDEVPGLDAHGRAVANWLLSMLVYLGASAVLSVVLIGLPLLLLVLLAGAVFPVIGAVKAADGRAWAYPLSIRFFGPPDRDAR